MARCEDAPCCGHGPEGCPDMSVTRTCKDCGAKFHPDNETWDYCYGCQAKHQIANGYRDDQGRWIDGDD